MNRKNLLPKQSNTTVIKAGDFPKESGEDESTNPGCRGRALANYLAEQFRTRGEAVEGSFPRVTEYAPEDVGPS